MSVLSNIKWYYHIIIGLILLWIYQNFVYQDHDEKSTLLNTSLGVIKGAKSEDGYNMYLGVPYAVVDKKNPFGESLPHPQFDCIFDATLEPDLCPQFQESDGRLAGSLDCLWLNIYAPKSANSSNLLPVLVWFPGGKFKFGSPGKYIYGPKFLLRHDIIVVTVSSRLGPYGFLCLGTAEIPGNQGLKDQVAALRWIKKHIREFGGDAGKVTIAGSSSSAFGVDLILRSDVEDLFDKIVLQSGTVEFKGVLVQENRDLLFNISSELGFNTANVTDALNFLAKIEPKTVIDASSLSDDDIGPCIEKEFDNATNLITKKSINVIRRATNISVLIGNVNNELLLVKKSYKDIDLNTTESMIRNKLLESLALDKDENELTKKVVQFYMESNEINDKFRDNLINFEADVVFYHPTQRFLNNYLKNGGNNAYHYVFSFVGGRNFMRNRNKIEGNGATHADELGYLFDVSYEKNLSMEDQLIIDRITTIWANFVKCGNPTPAITKLLPVKWLPVTDKKFYYLNITVDMQLKTCLYERRMTFWDHLYKKYGTNITEN